MNARTAILQRRIRWLTALFILGLVVSGATAIPLEPELALLSAWLGPGSPVAGTIPPPVLQWLSTARTALEHVAAVYPFLFYGTDWLAFGHFVIALVFVGAWRDPVRNRWLFDFGLIACALVLPWAFVFGAWRGIPLWWRLLDCSFGILGALPLWLSRKYVRQLE